MSAVPTLLLVEDDAVEELRPLCSTRPAFELRWGLWNLRERLEMAAPGRVAAVVRPHLHSLLEWSFPDLIPPADPEQRCLAINARAALSTAEVEKLLALSWPGELVLRPENAQDGRDWVAAWLEHRSALRLGEGGASLPGDLPSRTSGHRLFTHTWDLVAANGEALCEDARSLKERELPVRRIFGLRFEEGAKAHSFLKDKKLGDASRAAVFPGVHILEEQNVFFGADARLKPGVVLDAQNGPIVLGAGCQIESNVTIVGPAYVGPGTVVHPMARLRTGSSVGAMCKIGGEVEESIILDLSNKQHDGFLGHAYLGSWVNLGADTNASDLKNNYSTVRVDLGTGARDTGQRFVGPALGDHVRTGINTMLTTGTVAGVCANIFGADFPPRFIADFSWGGIPRVEYELAKAIETARVVHGRRGVVWDGRHEELLRWVHSVTEPLRGK